MTQLSESTLESSIHPSNGRQHQLAFVNLVAPNAEEAFVVATMQQRYRRSVTLAIGVALLCIGVGIGIIVGHFSAPGHSIAVDPVIERAEDDVISSKLQSEMSADRLRQNLRHYARKPHVAGTPADLEGAEEIVETWLDQGLDSAKLVPYKVYLQHPPAADDERANKIQIVDPANGTAVFTSALREDPFDEEELLQDGIPPPFNAYSATGDVTGDLVYVNYGRLVDFEYLRNELLPNVSLEGKILILKNGEMPRYTKIVNAERFGAVGVVLFSEPSSASNPMERPYPNGTLLPGTAAQRGYVLKDVGDILTPGYPAKDFAYRSRVNETKMPKIPVHPIGYDDAKKLLLALTGPQAKKEWSGKLASFYRVGPGFKAPYQGMTTRLVVNSVSELKYTYNTVGFIRGSVEPDRYVIIGNHRDAWALGAVDPSSGTATLMEVSRVFGKLKREIGWRPRRTLVFCTFAAEEYGLIGSIEWTEEFNKLIADRAVAYINMDIAVAGNYILWTSASPHLRPVIYEATKRVTDPDPSKSRQTVYDTMLERRGNSPSPSENVPVVNGIRYAGVSDHRGFILRLGVPYIMIYYQTYNMSFYSLYHTSYETIRFVETYVDPEYKFHLAAAQTLAEMVRILADSLVLPFNLSYYAQDLLIQVHFLTGSPLAAEIRQHGISLDHLTEAVIDFFEATQDFHQRTKDLDRNSHESVRQINDQLMQLEKAFIRELPGNRLDRHVLFSPCHTESKRDDMSHIFPGILDAYNDHNATTRWTKVAQQVAIVTHAIESASAILKDVTSW
ncbi:N-acetylated-alpha-linked acidic dipeptidase 2-like [Diadema setosum]|uniref:N-acetylated-alpha-linked acidic dipeptidase 2-like n=1 Tax=Diadema setosum TaxID=31175 RepID=UPI003B3B5F65